MKYLILSDIHGSLPRLDQALALFEREHCDMLCILGDILNYGPRNGLPEGLDPQGIVKRLNALKHRIVAIRGNCDSEVDQMLLEFPMMGDYALLVDQGVRLMLTHGHHLQAHQVPQVDVLCSGHTHLWQLEQLETGGIILNTGSITFPKGGNAPTVAIYENRHIEIHDLAGTILKELSF